MLQTFQNIFKIPELRRKILFTLLLFLIYRIGGHVPAPGIDARALGTFFAQAKGTLFGLYDLFVEGTSVGQPSSPLASCPIFRPQSSSSCWGR